ncbi:hypothetical protein [Novosphingopyxis sp.]|uniref:hypothetical protein n=1 Tax=Novosphingopyxis sp. TaxID=2709690 RepID=UPI003B5C02E3
MMLAGIGFIAMLDAADVNRVLQDGVELAAAEFAAAILFAASGRSYRCQSAIRFWPRRRTSPNSR